MSDNVLVMDTKIDLDGFKKGFDAIKNGTTGTAKAVNKTLDTVKKGSMQAAKTANQAIKTVEGAFKKIISIISLKKVFDKFRQYLETNLRKNQEYAASMKALRGSIAGAFQPIYEIAAPAIIYLVKLLNMVVQAIGRFIATLSGKSYSQMLKNSEALSKQKDLLEGVGGAASDAAKQLLGFDEINRLEDNSGGGGGSGMTFNEADLGSAAGAIDDFAKKLRELIQSGQFEEAGELVASCVNKMLDAFDAEKLGSTVGTWVQNFADFMNGLLFGIEWDKIGTVLAGGINGLLSKVKGTTIGEILRLKFTVAIGIFAGFIKDFDGSQAGTFLGDALLGFVQGLGRDIEKNFDDEFWDKLNQNIADGFDAFVPKFTDALTSAADTIAQQAPSAIETLGKIGTEIVDAISAALSAMDEEVEIALNQYDENGNQLTKIGNRWEELGYSVAEGLSKIDWEKTLKDGIGAAGNLANGIITFILSAVDGIGDEWNDIGARIAEGIKEIPWGEVFEKTGDVFLKLAKGIFDGLAALISSFTSEDMQNFIDSVGNAMKDLPWEDTIISAVKLAKVSGDFYVRLVAALFDAVTGANSATMLEQSNTNRDVVDKLQQQGKTEAEAWVEAYESGALEVLEGEDGSVIADAWNSVTFEKPEYFDRLEEEWAKKNWFEKLLAGFKSPVQVDESGRRYVNMPDITDNGTGGGLIIEAKEQGEDIGDALVDGTVNKLDERKDELGEAGEVVVTTVIDGEKKAGDIHSPSKETEKIGVALVDGLLIGLNTIDDKIGSFLDRFSGIIQKIADIAKNATEETANDTSLLSTDIATSFDAVAAGTDAMATQVDESTAAASQSIKDFRESAVADIEAVGEAFDALDEKMSEFGELPTDNLAATAPKLVEDTYAPRPAIGEFPTDDVRKAADTAAQVVESTEKLDLAGSKATEQLKDVSQAFDDTARKVDDFIAHFSELLEKGQSLDDVVRETEQLRQAGISGDDLLAGLDRVFEQADGQYAAALQMFQPYIDALNEAYAEIQAENKAKTGEIDALNDTVAESFADITAEASEMSSTLETLIDNFVTKFSEKVQKIIEVAKKAAATVSSEMAGLSGDVATSTSEVSSGVSGMSTQVDASLAAASSSFADFRNNAITDLSAVCSAMGQLAVQASALGSIQLGRIGTSMRYSSSPKWSVDFSNLYHAADGAVIPPNREFMAVFGDQRTGTNIEAPESLIRQIVREEAGSSGDSARLESLLEELIGTVSSIRIGDDTIGRAATRYSRAHGRATGV